MNNPWENTHHANHKKAMTQIISYISRKRNSKIFVLNLLILEFSLEKKDWTIFRTLCLINWQIDIYIMMFSSNSFKVAVLGCIVLSTIILSLIQEQIFMFYTINQLTLFSALLKFLKSNKKRFVIMSGIIIRISRFSFLKTG